LLNQYFEITYVLTFDPMLQLYDASIAIVNAWLIIMKLKNKHKLTLEGVVK